VKAQAAVKAFHPKMGERYLYSDGSAALLFTENETNMQRIFGVPNRSPYVKDGINNYVVHGQKDAVNPEEKGTKASAHYRVTINGGESATIRLRLSDRTPSAFAQSNHKRTGRSATLTTCSRPVTRTPTSSTPT